MASVHCECGFIKNNIPDDHIGKRAKCPKCKDGVLVEKDKVVTPESVTTEKDEYCIKEKEVSSVNNTNELKNNLTSKYSSVKYFFRWILGVIFLLAGLIAMLYSDSAFSIIPLAFSILLIPSIYHLIRPNMYYQINGIAKAFSLIIAIICILLGLGAFVFSKIFAGIICVIFSIPLFPDFYQYLTSKEAKLVKVMGIAIVILVGSWLFSQYMLIDMGYKSGSTIRSDSTPKKFENDTLHKSPVSKEKSAKIGLILWVILTIIVGIMISKMTTSKITIFGGGFIASLLILIILTPFFTQKPPPAPIQKKELTREDKINAQFSGWDGSHTKLERHIKSLANDPDSYKHVKTQFSDQGDYLIVLTVYRAKNGFGAVVLGSIKAKVDLNGNIIEFMNSN